MTTLNPSPRNPSPPNPSPLSTGSRALTRAAAFVAFANGVLHFVETPDYYGQQPYIGILFVVGGLALLLTAGLLARADDARGWALGALVMVGMLVGGLLSRTTGLPDFKEPEFEPSLLVAFAFEVLFLALWAVHARTRRS